MAISAHLPGNMANNLAADSQSLDALRLQARQDPDKALKQAAKQFETVFMNMMLKAMREATPQDGVFDSEQTKMFTSMLDQQLAQNMGNRGVGLADKAPPVPGRVRRSPAGCSPWQPRRP